MQKIMGWITLKTRMLKPKDKAAKPEPKTTRQKEADSSTRKRRNRKNDSSKSWEQTMSVTPLSKKREIF